MPSDYEYADTYLNADLWHADAAKAIEYQASSKWMKDHYRKCAEVRVLSAASDIIPPLRQWILDARSDGHDLWDEPSSLRLSPEGALGARYALQALEPGFHTHLWQ